MKRRITLYISLIILISATVLLLLNILNYNKVTIQFISEGKVVKEVKVEKGDEVTLPELTKENYVFDGWYYNGKKLDKSAWFDQDAIVNANWKELPKQMTITFDTDGGKQINPLIVSCQESLSLPIPKKRGYKFIAWQDQKMNTITNSSKLNCENTILKAKWELSQNSYYSLNLEDTLADVGIKKKFNTYNPKNDAINIYVFYGKECIHSREFLEFINSIVNEYGAYFKMEAFEVWHNSNNSSLLSEVSLHLNSKSTGVPYAIIGETVIRGYDSSLNSAIKKAITDLYNVNINDRYDVLDDMNI